MARFSAATPTEREELFADAIAAHRERGSAFCTFQPSFDAGASERGDGGDDGEDADGDDTDAEAATPEAPPWVQFGDGTLNVDCTEAELERLKALVGEFPSFTVEQLHSPEDAEGTNVRVGARADAERVAQFVERTFREVYRQPEGFVAWVTAL